MKGCRQEDGCLDDFVSAGALSFSRVQPSRLLVSRIAVTDFQRTRQHQCLNNVLGGVFELFQFLFHSNLCCSPYENIQSTVNEVFGALARILPGFTDTLLPGTS